jgi:hypothetical protein
MRRFLNNREGFRETLIKLSLSTRSIRLHSRQDEAKHAGDDDRIRAVYEEDQARISSDGSAMRRFGFGQFCKALPQKQCLFSVS